MKTLYIQYPSIVNLSIKSLLTAGGAVVRANDDGTFGPLLGNYQIEDACTVTFVKTNKPDSKLDTSRAGLAQRRVSIACDLRILLTWQVTAGRQLPPTLTPKLLCCLVVTRRLSVLTVRLALPLLFPATLPTRLLVSPTTR